MDMRKIFFGIVFSFCFVYIATKTDVIQRIKKTGSRAFDSAESAASSAAGFVENKAQRAADAIVSGAHAAGALAKEGAGKAIDIALTLDPTVQAVSLSAKLAERLLQFTSANLALKDSILYKDNPYKNTQATLRVGRQIHSLEAMYVNQRKAKAKEALGDLLGMPLNGSYVPTIATINSGGGTRALISMIGFHVGAQNTGLLDTVTYDVGLSGGSWFVSMWQQSKKSIYDFKNQFRDIVKSGIIGPDSKIPTPAENKLMGQSFIVRAGLEQPFTLVNIWGALIANRYLSPYGDRRQAVLFSQVLSHNDFDRYPFPILTAVDGEDYDVTVDHRSRIKWLEFTPHEVGGTGPWLGNMFVPTWAFGRKFKDKVSLNTNPEYDLGLLMGICGSAFGVSTSRIYEETLGDLGPLAKPIQFILDEMTDTAKIAVMHEFVALGKAHNFTRDAAGSPYKDKHKLLMCDAGIAFNLPYPPVSGHGPRKADILIFFDASGGLPKTGAQDLKIAELYARNHNLKFPKLPDGAAFFKATTQSIAIFKDENDPSVPLVIYFPLIADRAAVNYGPSIAPDFNTDFPTMKFSYNAKEYDNLSLITQQNVEQNIEKVKDAIAWKIAQHNGFVQTIVPERRSRQVAS